MSTSSHSKADLGASLLKVSAEQMIGWARLLLAVAMLCAAYLDPLLSHLIEPLAYILVVYLAFSVLALIFDAVLGPSAAAFVLATYIGDLVTAAVLIYFTLGINSPFFIFFGFLLLASALHWNWRGVAFTTAVLLVLLSAMVITNVRHDTDLALFILRASYLLIAGGMIAYFGAFRLRNQTRFAKLAAWPAADLVCDDKLSLGSSLGHAAGVLDSPRLLCVWEYADEAGQHYWRWENGASDASHETEAFPVISPKPEASIFITDRSRGRFALSGSKEKSPIISLPQQIQEKYRFDRVAVAPFSNPTCNGFLFVLDYHDRNNLLALATIAAHRIGAEIEHHWLWRHMQIAAVAQERSRLARNVHDGILQSLTATALNLKICGRHADERTRNEIDAIRAVLAQEQKRVRELIGKVHAQVGKRSFDLATNGRRLVSELEACWHCAIPLRVKPEGAKVSAETAAQLHLILAEAVANAAKHGRAKKVAINLERRAESLDIQIVDNGKGFPGLSGLYDDEALTGLRKRPRSICERVAEIGGHLTLSTSPGGSQLDIRLPI